MSSFHLVCDISSVHVSFPPASHMFQVICLLSADSMLGGVMIGYNVQGYCFGFQS